MTTVSAIIPTYNRAHTLARALESVFAQSRPPDEVIVVDDGSTDDTAAVVRRFPAVRYVRLQRNRGASHARNEGVRRARGELIAFLDSDDTWEPAKLGRQLERMAQPRPPALLCTGVAVVGQAGAVAHAPFPREPEGGWTFEQLQTYPFATSNWLIGQQALLDHGLFDETLPNCEDLDFLARLSARAAIDGLADALTVKHNQPDSLDADRMRTAASFAVLFQRHAALWARSPAAEARSRQRLANLHIRAGEMGLARKALLQAVRAQPLRPANWAILALSLLGQKRYLDVRGRIARP